MKRSLLKSFPYYSDNCPAQLSICKFKKPKTMKTTILKISVIFLFLSLMGAGCEKEEDEYSGLVEGYIVGSFICYEVGSDGQATGNYTGRGYCILLEGSKNTDSHWPMDFYTFDLPPGLFEFPEEILSSPVDYNGNNCGPSFFPDNLQTKFKISFKYRDVKKAEEIKFSCGPCTFMELTFSWRGYNQVILKNLSKIN